MAADAGLDAEQAGFLPMTDYSLEHARATTASISPIIIARRQA